MIACEFGCVEACKVLLSIPDIDVNVVNDEGVSFAFSNPQRISAKAQAWTNASNSSNRCSNEPPGKTRDQLKLEN
jgi:hypothetical protein